MNTSESTINIYSALIAVRSALTPIAKTRRANVVKFSYSYATLDSLIDMLTLALPKHGLGFIQSVGSIEGRPVLTTRIIHASGEFIEDTLFLFADADGGKNANQALGASVTYFKRYALSAMFGIATDEDTDGVADVQARKQVVKAQARAEIAENADGQDTMPQALSVSVPQQAVKQSAKDFLTAKIDFWMKTEGLSEVKVVDSVNLLMGSQFAVVDDFFTDEATIKAIATKIYQADKLGKNA